MLQRLGNGGFEFGTPANNEPPCRLPTVRNSHLTILSPSTSKVRSYEDWCSAGLEIAHGRRPDEPTTLPRLARVSRMSETVHNERRSDPKTVSEVEYQRRPSCGPSSPSIGSRGARTRMHIAEAALHCFTT